MTPPILAIASYWRLAVGAVLVGLLAAQTVRLAREQASHSQTIATHATARADAIQAARAQEQAHANQIVAAVHAQAARAMVAEADAVRAAGAADRLRDRAKAIASGVPGGAASAGSSEAAVLADVLGRVGEEARRAAAAADDAIGRGLACEASWPAVR